MVIPAIFFGWATQFNFCFDASCTNLAIYSLVPIGLIILLLNSILKKDYQIALLLLLLVLVSFFSFLRLYDRKYYSEYPERESMEETTYSVR